MKVIKGDITKLQVDAIINAANGYVGCMGAGVAGAIKKAGGFEIEKEAVSLCVRYRFDTGKTYYTKAGKLKCRYIIHAVTMKMPGQRCSLETVEKCLYSIFERANQLSCKTIAIPGLGTKIGKAPLGEVAEIYKRIIPDLEKKYGIEATVCDILDAFIREF